MLVIFHITTFNVTIQDLLHKILVRDALGGNRTHI